MSTKKK